MPIPKNASRQNIVVQFARRTKRDAVLDEARKAKIIGTDLGLVGANPVFINEHLCPELKKLLGQAISRKREVGWRFVWVRDGHILASYSESRQMWQGWFKRHTGKPGVFFYVRSFMLGIGRSFNSVIELLCTAINFVQSNCTNISIFSAFHRHVYMFFPRLGNLVISGCQLMHTLIKPAQCPLGDMFQSVTFALSCFFYPAVPFELLCLK